MRFDLLGDTDQLSTPYGAIQAAFRLLVRPRYPGFWRNRPVDLWDRPPTNPVAMEPSICATLIEPVVQAGRIRAEDAACRVYSEDSFAWNLHRLMRPSQHYIELSRLHAHVRGAHEDLRGLVEVMQMLAVGRMPSMFPEGERHAQALRTGRMRYDRFLSIYGPELADVLRKLVRQHSGLELVSASDHLAVGRRRSLGNVDGVEVVEYHAVHGLAPMGWVRNPSRCEVREATPPRPRGGQACVVRTAIQNLAWAMTCFKRDPAWKEPSVEGMLALAVQQTSGQPTEVLGTSLTDTITRWVIFHEVGHTKSAPAELELSLTLPPGKRSAFVAMTAELFADAYAFRRMNTALDDPTRLVRAAMLSPYCGVDRLSRSSDYDCSKRMCLRASLERDPEGFLLSQARRIRWMLGRRPTRNVRNWYRLQGEECCDFVRRRVKRLCIPRP